MDINKGIELMLRRAEPRPEEIKPKFGFGFNRSFSFLKREFYFNLEMRWDKK